MKKIVIMMILIMLTSLSFAIPENKLSNQVVSSNANLNQIANPSSSAYTVNIKSQSFQPSTLSVPAGTTVTWHNQDNAQHTVTSDTNGQFDSGAIATGKKFTHTFTDPGSYGYHCSIHPGVKGTIVVTGTSGLQSTQSTVTRTLLSSSAIQGINPGSAQGNSGNGGSPSWGEKQLSGQTTALSGATGGSMQSKSLQINLSIPVGQSSRAVVRARRGYAKVLPILSFYIRGSQGPAHLTYKDRFEGNGARHALLRLDSKGSALLAVSDLRSDHRRELPMDSGGFKLDSVRNGSTRLYAYHDHNVANGWPGLSLRGLS